MLTPEDANDLLCPLARTFASKVAFEGCRGPECAVWRWEKLTTSHPRWKDAVRLEASSTGERAPFPKAALKVANDPAAYGLVVERGYCGLGGEP